MISLTSGSNGLLFRCCCLFPTGSYYVFPPLMSSSFLLLYLSYICIWYARLESSVKIGYFLVLPVSSTDDKQVNELVVLLVELQISSMTIDWSFYCLALSLIVFNMVRLSVLLISLQVCAKSTRATEPPMLLFSAQFLFLNKYMNSGCYCLQLLELPELMDAATQEYMCM